MMLATAVLFALVFVKTFKMIFVCRSKTCKVSVSANNMTITLDGFFVEFVVVRQN